MNYSSPPNQQVYFEQVWNLTREVPYGKVATYGQIAQMLEPPTGVGAQEYRAFGSRWVGNAMAACPDDVPWHRIVNAQGRISERLGAQQQRALLEGEQILFMKDRIDLKSHQWRGLGQEQEDEPVQGSLF